nr:protein MLN51 homolog isoform X2 [Nicotiana tomentosiformis]
MMAGVGEKEVEEYESDPEEAKMSLKMRRREASSDDEEGEEKTEKPSRRIDDSDNDSEEEGQGAAAEYDEEYELEEEEYVEEEEVYDEGSVGNEESTVGEAEAILGEEDEVVKEVVRELNSGMDDGDGDEVVVVPGEANKPNEPYSVPTAGAFYMHDDRFRDNAAAAPHRRTFGGRKLWESKDDWKWGHDKFEELTMEERHYGEGRRTSRGRYRGRGRTRGAERGTSRGRRPDTYINDYNQSTDNNQKIQNNASKGVRGRGPRRYRPLSKENIDAPPLNKRSGQSVEKLSHNSIGKASVPVSNFENDGITSAKQGFISSLNYASPPFYPSGPSTKEITATHTRELQTGTSSHRAQPSLLGGSSAAAQSTAMLRGKDVSGSSGIDKYKIDGPISTVSGKLPSSLHMPPGSSSVNSKQAQPLRGQGRGFNTLPHMNYQYPVPNNQGSRVTQPTKVHSTQRNSAHSRGQPSLQVTQQLVQQSGTGSQSSPPKTGQTMNTFHGELESSSESGKSKSAMVVKGKGILQGTGRGSALYGGTLVMGTPESMGSGHVDQNLSATPPYLPVMQFGGQQPGGMRVPAVGMAFPGYVGQNSDMTWLPVLAGAARALGATYCSPYFAFDGGYHARPSGGQISSLTAAPSKEDSASKPNHERKPEQKNELTNDNPGQRQKNPRRYTEMKFDQ